VSQYFVVHFSNVSSQAEEFLSDNAFEWQALGMSEVLPFLQPEGEEEVFTQIPDRRAIDVYFESAPANGFIELIRAHFPDIGVNIESEQEKDWLAEWKKGFKPFELASGHWVVPSWCEPPAQAKHNIWIDPGMAFGTGTHETTQLVAKELVNLKGKSLLDVGTGTGILAIVAKQMGIPRVAATEIEADSRRVAHENFERNACADIQLDERQVEVLSEKFDIVVANIIDGVLVRIQEALKARVRPGGWLVLSGIIGEREKDFLEGFKVPGDVWDIRRQQGDWILYAKRF
jgi:ribosomal protein L11 methyltransferase